MGLRSVTFSLVLGALGTAFSGFWKSRHEGPGWGYDGYGFPFSWFMNGAMGEFVPSRQDFLLPGLVLDVVFYSVIILTVVKIGISARSHYSGE